MRNLVYVPVIHMAADIGSLAEKAVERAILSIGEDVWKRHTETVFGFWSSIADYFDSFEAYGVKIFQDGMVADGELGKKIIEEGMKAGSVNFRVLSGLLQRGAVLVRTEEFKLLKEERDRLVELGKAQTKMERLKAYLKYRIVKGRLLKKRDAFMARRINEVLKEGETGVLFIGAEHNIEDWLDRDISMVELKDKKMLRAYQRGFIHWNNHKEKTDKLALYLVSPVAPEKRRSIAS
ncbi:MAG: hypothetical protein HY954_08660 [Deltaproteobacteria bacterium]|nr:hypothetical protein [Deltaproteobacteria bacterium]